MKKNKTQNPKPSSENDVMEIGDTGLIPLADGWFKDSMTGFQIDPSGKVYDTSGVLVFDPDDESESLYDEDDYEWYK